MRSGLISTPALAPAPVVALCFAALPAWGGGLTCPAGWRSDARACHVPECVAPMGGGLIRVDRYASLDGMSFPQAFDSIQKAVGADGTPLHDLLSEEAVEVAGLPGLRRDYIGSARGMDLHIALVLVRHAGDDILLRAVWTLDHDALFALLVAPSIESWDPRVRD